MTNTTKYQVRIKDTMSDKPAAPIRDTYKEAATDLEEVKKELEKWATPCPEAAYINEIITRK